MSFLCVWSMVHRSAWSEWKLLLDVEMSVFAWLYGVLIPSIPSTSSCEKKIAPFGHGVMARLWIPTTGFGVYLWQSLNNSSGHLPNTQRHRMAIGNLILDGQVHSSFSENKQYQNSIVRDENACFPVYWNCLKKIFACKLNYFKQSSIWCHFHSTRMTTEEFFTQPTAFWKCVFEGMCIWDTVMAKLGMGIINDDSWFMGIKKWKMWA